MQEKALYIVCWWCSSTNLCYNISQKVTFYSGKGKNVRCLKNRTIVGADPGSLPTAKMELFVTIVYGSKPYIIELSQGVSP